MALFEALDDLYQKVFNYHEYSRIFVTFAAYFGSLLLFYYILKFLLLLLQGVRLYVISQFKCCQIDFVKRYGKWAVITGATDGIGQSIAKELASRGMSILVVGRNPTKLAATKTLLEAIPNVGDVETVKIDLSISSLENFDSIRQQLDADNRDIGVLVNNAGVFPDKFRRFNRFDMQELATTANLNMLNPLHMTRMIMPGMVTRGKGMVMNVSSILGFITVPYMSIYSSTKTFVNAFTRQLQAEYGSHPIDIVLLTPGPVQTIPFAAMTTNTKPSLLAPSPDHYARVAINAASARYDQYCGYYFHAILTHFNALLESIGLLNPVIRLNLKMGARSAELSPVLKRKKLADSQASA